MKMKEQAVYVAVWILADFTTYLWSRAVLEFVLTVILLLLYAITIFRIQNEEANND